MPTGLILHEVYSADTLIEAIFVPGVLAHGELQHAPLFDEFTRRGISITVADYVGPRFDAMAAITVIVDHVRERIRANRRVILFGSSLGGSNVANALMLLRQEFSVEELNEMVSTIIVDAPADPKGPVVAPLPMSFNSMVARLARRLSPSEKANTGYGAKVLEMFRQPPKPDAIEEPTAEQLSAWLDSAVSMDDYRQHVMNTAIEGLSGHEFTLFYDQVAWMLNRVLPLKLLDGLDITYYRCNRNNVTIHQPYTSDLWAPHVSQLIEVDTAHCAYLEARPTWTRLMDEWLGGHRLLA